MKYDIGTPYGPMTVTIPLHGGPVTLTPNVPVNVVAATAILFCGGEGHVTDGQRVGTRDHCWRWVRCRACGAQSGGQCSAGDPKRSERDAIAAWNKRESDYETRRAPNEDES